jgi:hypothetical protein
LLVFVSFLETVGHPNFLEVAHELIATTRKRIPIKAIILFFIGGYFFYKRKIIDFSARR